MRFPRLCLAVAGTLSLTTVSAAERVQFNRDIRPIFSDTCFACHGPDENKIKGGLRSTPSKRRAREANPANPPSRRDIPTRAR
jgi:mono/diheme cytochrome c family protein